MDAPFHPKQRSALDSEQQGDVKSIKLGNTISTGVAHADAR
jgi:hypothetical protein